MRIAGFRDKMLSGAPLAGTFLKTPSYQVVEVLAQSELDFLCLDAEHAPFDRAALDVCLGMGRALDLPMLVRVGEASPAAILQALDHGALGVVLPHVTGAAQARDLARAARFGLHGRGYAGSSRWAGYATRSMPDLLAQSRLETVVIAQIEEPEAVEASAQIAAVDGIDGLFLGPADLSVGLGYDHQSSDALKGALARVGEAARAANKAYMSFVPDAEAARLWADAYGMSMFFVASEHGWMRAGANTAARGIHAL